MDPRLAISAVAIFVLVHAAATSANLGAPRRVSAEEWGALALPLASEEAGEVRSFLQIGTAVHEGAFGSSANQTGARAKALAAVHEGTGGGSSANQTRARATILVGIANVAGMGKDSLFQSKAHVRHSGLKDQDYATSYEKMGFGNICLVITVVLAIILVVSLVVLWVEVRWRGMSRSEDAPEGGPQPVYQKTSLDSQPSLTSPGSLLHGSYPAPRQEDPLAALRQASTKRFYIGDTMSKYAAGRPERPSTDRTGAPEWRGPTSPQNLPPTPHFSDRAVKDDASMTSGEEIVHFTKDSPGQGIEQPSSPMSLWWKGQ